MCSAVSNQCSENKKKNSIGVKQAHQDGLMTTYEDYSAESKDKMAWSKGLTAKTDNRVLEQSILLKDYYTRNPANFLGCKHSVESKKLMSEKRITYLETKSKFCEWYEINGIKVQGSIEREFALFLFDQGIKFSRRRLSYRSHRSYTPDFYLDDYDLYVEAKGFFFEKDKYKTSLVLEENFIDLRILYKKDLNMMKTIEDVFRLDHISSHISDIDMSVFINHWDK